MDGFPYKSHNLNALIQWDMMQLFAGQDEGKLLADITIYSYTPSRLMTDESYTFQWMGVKFGFIISMSERPEIATRALLGIPQTICKELYYVLNKTMSA